MSRVITYSRFFPSHHPRKGEPTYFVEKIIKAFPDITVDSSFMAQLAGYYDFTLQVDKPKFHTIRKGNRWKVGDKFSPRVWSGRPYASKQIIITPDIEIKKVWDIKIEGYYIWINKNLYSNHPTNTSCAVLAQNDGLTAIELHQWLNVKNAQSFYGQIICWNDKISY